MNLTVTQFMRPDGRWKSIHLTIPDDYKAKVEEYQSRDCEITCEQLRTGEAAQYISCSEGDFAIAISPSGKKADAALLKMINQFDIAEFDEWLKGMVE